jgi:hypothetical protein
MQFYMMGDLRTKDRTYDAEGSRMKPTGLGEASQCPNCNRYVSMLHWLPPYHTDIVVHGKQLGDVVDCSNASILVSERFRDAWLAEELKGINEFSPLERLRIRPARLGKTRPTYFHVSPGLFGTQIDVERSLIEYSAPITCSKCKSGDIQSARGVVIDKASWTGEDLFFPWGMSGRVIVTERVRQIRDKYGLTNMNLVPTEEVLIDHYRRWTPYCDYLPDGFTPKAEHEYEYVTEEDPPTN